MKKGLYSAVLTLAFGGILTTPAWAQTADAARIATKTDSRCSTPNDPYAPAPMMTEASPKFSGQCLNTDVFRPAKVLSETDTEIKFANFIHDNQYWIATVPKNPKIYNKIFFQIQRFPIVKGVEAAHVQMRVRLNPGEFVQLENQTQPGKTAKVNSFIASSEAARPKNNDYNFALGVFDNYVLVGRIASGEQRQMERSTTNTEQYELNLSQEEQAFVAVEAIKRSDARGATTFYNTLRPNCTTEVLDLLDLIPRLKGKFPQFLTVIAPDPIAQPSLNALQSRGLLKGRVQSMGDELKNSNFSQDTAVAMPVENKTQLSFLPSVQGAPWTMVITLPVMKDLTPSERAAILKIRQEVINRIPLMIQGIGSAVMLDGGLQQVSSNEIMNLVMEKIQAELKTDLQSLNANLSEKSRLMGIFLVPFRTQGKTVTVQINGAQAALPFSVLDYEVDPEISKTQEVFYYIAEGDRMASDEGLKMNSQAYLRGATVQIQLQKNNSSSIAQVLIGTKTMQKEFTMTNSQVKFSQVLIPSASSQRAYRPVVLMTHVQKAFAPVQENVSVEFGAEGGITGRGDMERFGQFQIMKGASCDLQANSVPTLIGVFAEAPLDNGVANKMLKGKPVSFGIFSAQVNVRTQKISSMEVKVGTWPVTCLDVDNVNSQFKDQANSMIEKYKKEVNEENILNTILGAILK